jgi:polyisoprenoid-binding protein YceI
MMEMTSVSKLLLAAGLLSALSLAAALPAAAQAVTADPAAVKSGTYNVEPKHTQVGFTISHLGLTDFSGVLHDASGSLTLNATDPAASSLKVTVPAASLMTTLPTLDGLLKSANWFDVATFPNATFVSTKITRTGPGTATVDGDLTIHGVTKPVRLNAKLVGSGLNITSHVYSVGFSATTAIKRSDFGIKALVPALTDDVTLNIQMAFEPQPQP